MLHLDEGPKIMYGYRDTTPPCAPGSSAAGAANAIKSVRYFLFVQKRIGFMKAFVFGGAGLLGSTSAFLLAKEGLCDEIVLCDLFADKAKNHAMDMSQAVYAVSKTKITAGTLADMAGSGLVISGFSIPTTNPGAWTYDDTKRSLPVLRELAEALRTYAPNAVVVSMTNPLDAINYTLWKLSGLPRRQFIGFSFNDSLRMRWGIGNYLGICPQHIRCASMGEHGGQKVQIYSHVEIDGALRPFTEEEVRASDALQKSFWDEFYPLGALRTAGWTSAMGMLEVVEHIAGRRTGYVGCSCVLDGEYGLKDLSIGVPAHLGPGGVEKIEEFDLNERERAGFYGAAENIQKVIAQTFTAMDPAAGQ